MQNSQTAKRAVMQPHAQKTKAPAGDAAQGFQKNAKQSAPNSAESRQEAQAGREGLLRAQAAGLGVTMIRTADAFGRPLFAVSRWGLIKHLDSLDSVAAFLRRVGGRDVG